MMFKGVFATLITAGISVATTLIAVDWQRESLSYELTESMRPSGEIRQQIRITNTGWEPAMNVKISLREARLTADQVTATPPFDVPGSAHMVGGYERIRRNETVLIDITYSGTALSPEDLSIKSDRTIALEADALDETDWTSWIRNMVRTLLEDEKPAAAAATGSGCIPI